MNNCYSMREDLTSNKRFLGISSGVLRKSSGRFILAFIRKLDFRKKAANKAEFHVGAFLSSTMSFVEWWEARERAERFGKTGGNARFAGGASTTPTKEKNYAIRVT